MFAADVDVVCEALADAAYLAEGMAKLPDIGAGLIELQEREGSTIRQHVRYVFRGKLPLAVTKFVNPSKLSWIEDTTIDAALRTATFTMTPVHYKQFFRCTGEWALSPVGTAKEPQTLRRIDGNLKVNSPVPFLGGEIEKAIVSGLRERLALEPDVMASWLNRNR